MKQITFSELDYLSKRKITKKERFLAEMEQVVPFARLEAVIEPHYPKTGAKGAIKGARVELKAKLIN